MIDFADSGRFYITEDRVTVGLQVKGCHLYDWLCISLWLYMEYGTCWQRQPFDLCSSVHIPMSTRKHLDQHTGHKSQTTILFVAVCNLGKACAEITMINSRLHVLNMF